VEEAPADLPQEICEAASRGWRLIPIKVGAKKPPLLKNWQKRATSDLQQLKIWASKFSGCNWAVATGPGSGVWVLDVDGENGKSALVEFHLQGLILPDTLSVRSPNGAHFYFRNPPGLSVRNSVETLARGLDTRGDRGYTLIPPSVHPSGTPYTYDDPNASVMDAPKRLLEMIARNEAPATRIQRAPFGILAEGTRNDGLFRYGCAERRRGASLQELEEMLLQANGRRCSPPLPDLEVLRIAASSATYPVGGPDPLETAWIAVGAGTYSRGYGQFIALPRSLQCARPGLSIALPLQRIGGMMGCDWTQVRRWRRRAVEEGLLIPTGRYVPHRRAARYIFIECPTRVSHYKSPLVA